MRKSNVSGIGKPFENSLQRDLDDMERICNNNPEILKLINESRIGIIETQLKISKEKAEREFNHKKELIEHGIKYWVIKEDFFIKF